MLTASKRSLRAHCPLSSLPSIRSHFSQNPARTHHVKAPVTHHKGGGRPVGCSPIHARSCLARRASTAPGSDRQLARAVRSTHGRHSVAAAPATAAAPAAAAPAVAIPAAATPSTARSGIVGGCGRRISVPRIDPPLLPFRDDVPARLYLLWRRRAHKTIWYIAFFFTPFQCLLHKDASGSVSSN